MRDFDARFASWFGSSKVVDGTGAPLVVYHGTPMSFSEFGVFPIFFTEDPGAAAGYALQQYAPKGTDSGPNVMPVYLSLQAPKELTGRQLHRLIPANDDDIHSIEWCDFDALADEFEQAGHDGVIIRGVVDFAGNSQGGREWRAYTQYVAFRPEQVKSAIGNCGAYNARDRDILR